MRAKNCCCGEWTDRYRAFRWPTHGLACRPLASLRPEAGVPLKGVSQSPLRIRGAHTPTGLRRRRIRFGNRPGAGVFTFPEEAACMRQQDLDRVSWLETIIRVKRSNEPAHGNCGGGDQYRA